MESSKAVSVQNHFFINDWLEAVGDKSPEQRVLWAAFELTATTATKEFSENSQTSEGANTESSV